MDKRETLAPCVTTLNSQSFNSEIIRLLIIIKHSKTVGKIIIKSGPSCTWLRKIWTLVSSVIWSIFYCFLLVLFHLSLSKSIIGSRDSTISIQFSPLFAPMDNDHMTMHLQCATKRETTTNKDSIISSQSNEINICRLHMIWKQLHSNELADLTSLCSCERAQSFKNKLSKSKIALKKL